MTIFIFFTFSIFKKIWSYFKPPSVDAATIEVESENPSSDNKIVEESDNDQVKDSAIKKNKVGFRDR